MRRMMIFVIGLTFGVAGGFTLAAGSGIKAKGHKNANLDHIDMDNSAIWH